MADECEEIVKQTWAPALYGALRYILVGQTTRSFFKVVMAGSHRFLTQIHQNGSPLRNVLKYHTLHVLDTQSTRDLITQPMGRILSDAAVRTIAMQSGGHPFLTQYIMHHLYEGRGEDIEPRIVERVAANFPHERHDFWDWVNDLLNSSLKAYKVLAETGQPIAISDARTALRPAPPDLLQALDALCYHGLVVRDINEGSYQITCYMFRNWFMTNLPELSEDEKEASISIFISYAHADEVLRNELGKHLGLLKRQDVITTWHDRMINAGTEWKKEIDDHLRTARVILLLVSADFLASDYCYDVEVQEALARHDAGKACVIPIILRAVDWQNAPFGKLQALPKDGKPVTSWSNLDEAFVDIARGIRTRVEELGRVCKLES